MVYFQFYDLIQNYTKIHIKILKEQFVERYNINSLEYKFHALKYEYL